MIQINLIRDRKIARVAGKAAGPGFKLALPQLPFNLGILFSVLAFVVVLLVIGLTFVSQRARMAQLRNQINSHSSELTKLSGPKRLVDEYIVKKQEVNTKLNEISSIDKGRFDVVKVMAALGGSVPEHLWLVQSIYDGGKITLEGVTYSNIIVADFMERLKASGYFSGVELAKAEKIEIEERELVKFSLSADVSIPAAPAFTDSTSKAASAAGKGKP
jgi:type IV pilus assembly protein PilN